MHVKKLTLFICLLLALACTNAQSLYHLEYKLPADNTAYNAFLVFFEDGTGLVRFRYMRNNEDMVLEADALEEPSAQNGISDTLSTLFSFINPRIIVGTKIN